MRIMGIELQIAMIIGALLALGIVLHGAIKLNLNIKYAVVLKKEREDEKQ